MDAREHILQRLRSHLRLSTLPRPWQSQRRFDDPVTRFAESLVQVGGEPFVVTDTNEALDVLESLLQKISARRIILNPEPPIDMWDLPRRWSSYEWFVVGHNVGATKDFAASADVGISGVVAALAETGTVVLASGPYSSRLATLLPPLHIAVVPASLITTDLFTWVSMRPQPMPAALTFVTGPSKTADIEQTLTVGVHGPRRMITIVITAL